MKILVTGGTGFIGSRLVKKLIDEGHEVVILDKSSKNADERAKFIQGDILDQEDIERAMKGCSAVFHLAAITQIGADEDKTYKVNFIGSKNIFNQAKKQKARIIFTSTASVYGNTPAPHRESAECSPISFYGKTKLNAEKLIPDAFIVRLFNVYGPGGNGVLNLFAENIPKYEDIIIFGTGTQTRDFVHVDDVVNVLMKGLEFEGIYNVGTGRETSLLSLADMIFSITKNKPNIKFGMPKEGDIRRSVANIDHLKKYGWEPKISLEDGLKMLLHDKLPKN